MCAVWFGVYAGACGRSRGMEKFIDSQVFYKQSDLVIWCVLLEERKKLLRVYPDCDVEIILCNEGENILAKFSLAEEKVEKEYQN